MATTASHETSHDHHEESFWRKYVFSTDHKVIGIQYGLTSLVFLFFGFTLIMLMRWQLAYPGEPIPIFGFLFGDETMPGGVMLPEFYNQLGRYAWNHHGIPRHCTAGGRGFRELCCATANRCAPDMAFPEAEYGQLLGLFLWWRCHAGQLLVPGRCSKSRMDFISTACLILRPPARPCGLSG